VELRQFRYFLSIVDCGSLSRASQQLFIAQSALSKQIADLEDELGVQLLHRNRSGVVPTEAGKTFYDHAQSVLRLVNGTKAAVLTAAEAVSGSIVVALPQSMAAMLAMPLMRAAKARYPQVILHLNEELTGNMVEQMIRGQVDVAMFTDAPLPEEFEFTPVLEEDFYLLHAADDEHAPPPGDVTIEVALARPLVYPSHAHSHSTRAIVESAVQAGGLKMISMAAEVNSVHALISVVEAGIGPTIMPLGVALREIEDGRLVAHRILCKGMSRTLGVCVSSHVPLTNTKKALSSLLIELSRELCTSGKWPGTTLVS
jgi:LysR family transcriptional regulator, nitrogen assimilation regulatory protein